MYAPANKVDNIIVTVDYNGQQIDGSTEDVLDIGNLKLKLEKNQSYIINYNGLKKIE